SVRLRWPARRLSFKTNEFSEERMKGVVRRIHVDRDCVSCAGSAWAGRNILTAGISILETALSGLAGHVADDGPGRAAYSSANGRTTDIVPDGTANDRTGCSPYARTLLSRRAAGKRNTCQKAQHQLPHHSLLRNAQKNRMSQQPPSSKYS